MPRATDLAGASGRPNLLEQQHFPHTDKTERRHRERRLEPRGNHPFVPNQARNPVDMGAPVAGTFAFHLFPRF